MSYAAVPHATHMTPSLHDTPNHALAHGSPTPQLELYDHSFPFVLANSSFNAAT
jgi:hypothetical protein